MAVSNVEPITVEPEPRTEWRDDQLVNVDTGEIIETREPAFRIDSFGAAEWVLDRMARNEAAIVALRVRLEAIHTNLEAMITTEQRALDGLHRRFDGELEAFARAELEGGRTKTLRTAYGSISFRIVKAGRKIVDMAAAVKFAKIWAPDAVRVKEDVLLSDLEQWSQARGYHINGMTAVEAMIEVPWLETRPEEERMYLRTGVES